MTREDAEKNLDDFRRKTRENIAARHHVEKDWIPCPRCQGDPERMEGCKYCAGTGATYRGEPHHA